jgi:hypothetical protein
MTLAMSAGKARNKMCDMDIWPPYWSIAIADQVFDPTGVAGLFSAAPENQFLERTMR